MIEVDPVECVIAVIGVKPILSKEVERVSMVQAREMADLPKRIYQEAKLVVGGETSKVPLGAVNYKKMLHDLTEEYNVEQLTSMVEKFPPILHALTGQVIVKAAQLVQFLRQLFPIQTKQTLLGPENILPPALAVRRFATALDVLDSPMRVFAHIACGSLLKSQVEVVKHVYPSISAAITDALTEAGVAEKAKKDSFKLPTRVEIGAGTWMGMPRISASLHAALQGNFTKAREEKAKSNEQASGGKNSVAAKAALTNTQAALYPAQTSK